MTDTGGSLEAVQRTFAKALFDEAAMPNTAISDRGCQLYAESVTGNLVGVLRAGFPIVREFVGREFFDVVATDYVRRNLPTSPCLSRYGGGFPNDLAQRRELAAWPAIHDIAQWEWVCKKLLVASDIGTQADRMTSTCAATTLLAVAPAIAPFQSHFDVASIIDWHRNKTAVRPNLERATKPNFWALRRNGNQIVSQTLDPLGYCMLVAAFEDRLLMEIERLAVLAGRQAVSEQLASLIAGGTIVTTA